FLSFADLVVIAKEFYPIPFRTRPSKPSASMVLRLKPRESRTLPGLPRTEIREPANTIQKPRTLTRAGLFLFRAAFGARLLPLGLLFYRGPVKSLLRRPIDVDIDLDN